MPVQIQKRTGNIHSDSFSSVSVSVSYPERQSGTVHTGFSQFQCCAVSPGDQSFISALDFSFRFLVSDPLFTSGCLKQFSVMAVPFLIRFCFPVFLLFNSRQFDRICYLLFSEGCITVSLFRAVPFLSVHLIIRKNFLLLHAKTDFLPKTQSESDLSG